MLGKAVRVQNKNLVNSAVSLTIQISSLNPSSFVLQKVAFSSGPAHTRASPTILHKALNIVDRGTTAFSVSKFDPTQVLQVSSRDVASLLSHGPPDR